MQDLKKISLKQKYQTLNGLCCGHRHYRFFAMVLFAVVIVGEIIVIIITIILFPSLNNYKGMTYG